MCRCYLTAFHLVVRALTLDGFDAEDLGGLCIGGSVWRLGEQPLLIRVALPSPQPLGSP